MTQQPTATVRPASEKQAALIHRLTDERAVPVAGRTADEAFLIARHEDVRGQAKFVSTREASAVIDWLLSLPLKQTTRVSEPTTPVAAGFYLAEGAIYRVQPSRSSGHLYATVLVLGGQGQKGRFEYAPGALRALTAEHRLTTEQAADYGHHHGICGICGATLTDPSSVERGIGPVCATRL